MADQKILTDEQLAMKCDICGHPAPLHCRMRRTCKGEPGGIKVEVEFHEPKKEE